MAILGVAVVIFFFDNLREKRGVRSVVTTVLPGTESSSEHENKGGFKKENKDYK